MSGGYLFESAKCMALTLQLMQGSAATGPVEESLLDYRLVNEYRAEATFWQENTHGSGIEDSIGRNSLLDFYEKLAVLRNDALINDLLTHGDFKLAAQEDAHVFAFERSLKGRRFLIVSNWSKEFLDFSLSKDCLGGDVQVSVYPETVMAKQMKLRPYEAFAVLI
ncbi:hypothetical protein GRF59_08780 [Paenibacillus sp. HJL G12]|uniref:Maltogenic Amylase C-terminal domain-containing protein n=1 Tax=Paenibacillus dendrobii TaxID=2691084 RepID=A0A7X3LFJ2_9BACL|nr:hypothetical protein [Paenibacillus dendrobii]MWV43731.1 hypothetical protein [Paenibacillus dendrobii]